MPVLGGIVNINSPMGANLMRSGVGFRCFAPNAHYVAVFAGAGLTGAIAAAAAAGWAPVAGDKLEDLGDHSWGGYIDGIREGDPYMFYVSGDDGTPGWKRDPFARELTQTPPFPQSYCMVRDPGTFPWQANAWRMPDFSDMIIYQFHVGTWWAEDGAGADVRADRYGTFLDAAQKLPYLQGLGINAVQPLPIQEFVTQFSWGYNGVDYFSPETEYVAPPATLAGWLPKINALYGRFGMAAALTIADLTPGINQLKCFIDLCHLHGIAVIFDLVYNHAGGDFDPQSLFFFDHQQHINNNYSLYFTDQGWANGLIFAYWNNWISQFLIDNARYFLTEYRIDGIRYDEVRVINNNGGQGFCRNLTDTARATNRAAIQIAEYWNDDRPYAIQPTPRGLGFDAELGDGLRDALRDLLGQAAVGEHAAISLCRTAATLMPPGGFQDAWRVVQCIENQDKTHEAHADAFRVAWAADPAGRSWYAASRCHVATSLIMTAPGIPSLFMGEEFMEDKKWSDDRNYRDARGFSGFIWWDGALGVDRVMSDFFRFMTDLIHLRRAQPALRASGVRVTRVNNYERVIILHRWMEWEGKDVVVIASLDENPKWSYPVGFPSTGKWNEILNSHYYWNFPNPGTIGNGGSVEAFGPPMDQFSTSSIINVPPNGILVFSHA